MKKHNHAITVILAALALPALAQARDVQNLNFGWTFTSPAGETRTVNLPHDFQIEQPWIAPAADEGANNNDAAANVRSRLSPRGFKEMGEGVYTLEYTPADSLRGKRILLDFQGIMLVGDVYLNDERVGGTDYGYLGFEIDVTNKLRFGEPNLIKVVASTGEPLNSRWYTGGGLYRDVNLVTTSRDLYFNRHGLIINTPEVGEDRATVKISGEINAAKPNSAFIADIDILNGDGEVVAHSADTIAIEPKWRNRVYDLASFEIENPQLWDTESPNLYTADIRLRRLDGTVADDANTGFGIRSIEFSPDFGMKLNGRKVLLKGIANHHTLGALGAAAYPRAIEKRLELLKSFGFNHVRSSHNPYSEDFLRLCDKHGILVVDELYDKWLTQYAGGRKEWTELWQNDIPEWIRRDRNHPSVVVWSLGNELQGYSNLPFNDWGVTAYRLQKTLLEHYDSTRPVTVAMHPRVRDISTDSIPAPLALETDIASYNYRYMYFPGDARRYPNLIFYQSEANLTNMGPNFFEPDNDKVLGLAYWGMIDYLGESLGWPAKGWSDGVFDISLQPKANAYFIKSMFSDEPMVHIGIVGKDTKIVDWNGIAIGQEKVADHWNYNPGDTLRIYTYTNADEVSLRLNGREIGRQQNSSDPRKRNRIVWDEIPYSSGTLEAVAFTNGREVARHRLRTAGAPKRLVVESDNPGWNADGIDLQHITVKAVDRNGTCVPYADTDITFEILDGDAEIVAVSNGDMTSEELNVQNHRRLFNGKALAIVRAGRTPGTVKLRVSGEGFRPVTLDLPMN